MAIESSKGLWKKSLTYYTASRRNNIITMITTTLRWNARVYILYCGFDIKHEVTWGDLKTLHREEQTQLFPEDRWAA